MSKNSSKQIRFAVLIRVSTEKQEKQGESLRTQQAQITQAVEQLGGRIVVTFAGQEHATAGYEREQVQTLLKEAARKPCKFDAIMVADPTRWSRDNVASENGLEILRTNGIRFFSLSQEFDLFDPSPRLYLALSTTFGAYHARIQKQKSLLNRIERAKRGIPTCGKFPYGRSYDRKTNKWVVDAEKQKLIVEVAERYLAGEQMPALAQEYGVNHASLHKTLTRRSGADWEINFDSDDLNIHEVVKFKIPPLLSEKTIRAVRQKAEANRTYLHGQPKYEYLLSGMIFCAECGYAMFGQTNHGGRRYYRHAHTERAKECPLNPRPWVRAEVIEYSVFYHLFDSFGNPQGVERAIERATPKMDLLRKFEEHRKQFEVKLKKIEAARARLQRALTQDLLPEADIFNELKKLKDEELKERSILDALMEQMGHLPTPEEIRTQAGRVSASFRSEQLRANTRRSVWMDHFARDYEDMTSDDKRHLAREVFDGVGPDGRPYGVYLECLPDQAKFRKKKHRFELRGRLFEGKSVDGERAVTQSSNHCKAEALRGFRFWRRSLRSAE